MADVIPIEFRYFSPRKGCVISRPGYVGTYIGATRGPSSFTVNPDAVVLIPAGEVQLYLREYRTVLKSGKLIERKEADYVAFRDARRKKSKAAAAARTPKKVEPAPAAAKSTTDDSAEEQTE